MMTGAVYLNIVKPEIVKRVLGVDCFGIIIVMDFVDKLPKWYS